KASPRGNSSGKERVVFDAVFLEGMKEGDLPGFFKKGLDPFFPGSMFIQLDRLTRDQRKNVVKSVDALEAKYTASNHVGIVLTATWEYSMISNSAPTEFTILNGNLSGGFYVRYTNKEKPPSGGFYKPPPRKGPPDKGFSGGFYL